MAKNIYLVYSIKDYAKANDLFIKNGMTTFSNINDLIVKLKKYNNFFHFRIHPKTKYIFFGNLNGLSCDINTFITHLLEFMRTSYNLILDKNDVMYTQNTDKNNSYHYSIPK